MNFEDYLDLKVKSSIAFLEKMIPVWEETNTSPNSQYELKRQPKRLVRLKSGKLNDEDIAEYRSLYDHDVRLNQMRLDRGLTPLPIFGAAVDQGCDRT